MKEARVPIAKEGYPFIVFAALLALVLAILGHDRASLSALVLTAFVMNFFRDPERVPDEDPTALISPADGKVIIIDKVYDERFLGTEVIKVSIFMNIFDVHVNRAPFSGRVDKVIYKAGAFYSADTQRSSLENESCALLMTTERGRRLVVVQIAGLIARRIICWAGCGDILQKGQRFGLIRFGSRVDLFLPTDIELRVVKGQKVRAGETVLGYLPLN
ncbi:MAG: phosphatidylserine decarboxylase family protein [Desulfobulbaceae bacterium]|nr:phosphatidylserine decarboxylase family protein [Desulfobulbaceae bacterium]